MSAKEPTLAEIEARHKQADNWMRNRSLSAIRVHDDRAHLLRLVRERDAEIANQRAEWATAMADIVRLREALRQWQLGVGDTEIELALKERDARLAEIAREVEDNMPPRGVKTPVTAIRETLRRIYNIAKGDAA